MGNRARLPVGCLGRVINRNVGVKPVASCSALFLTARPRRRRGCPSGAALDRFPPCGQAPAVCPSQAACLRRIDEPLEILERADAVGNAWRHHYDRLHLHTDRDRSALPYASWPAGTPRYPSRTQVVAYLEAYPAAEGFGRASGAPSSRPDA